VSLAGLPMGGGGTGGPLALPDGAGSAALALRPWLAKIVPSPPADHSPPPAHGRRDHIGRRRAARAWRGGFGHHFQPVGIAAARQLGVDPVRGRGQRRLALAQTLAQ